MHVQLQQPSADVTWSALKLAKQCKVLLGETWLSMHIAAMTLGAPALCCPQQEQKVQHCAAWQSCTPQT